MPPSSPPRRQSKPPSRTPAPAPQQTAAAPDKNRLIQEGMAFYRQDKYREAAAKFEAAAKASPTDHTAWNLLGSCYFALRDNAKLIETYLAAANAMPDDAESYYNLGLAYSYTGDATKAREAYSRAIQLDPAHTQAHAGLGKLLQAEGKTGEAMKEFQYEIDYCRNLIKEKPDDPAPLHRLAHFYLQCGIATDDAIACAEKAISLQPDEPRYMATAAQLYYRKGDRDKAIELIDKAIAKAPDSAYYQAIKRNITAPPTRPPSDGAATDDKSEGATSPAANGSAPPTGDK